MIKIATVHYIAIILQIHNQRSGW